MDSLPGQVGRKAMGVSEFCEVMDLSRSTVHKLIRDGKIRSTKIYGKRVIDASEPERLLAGEAK